MAELARIGVSISEKLLKEFDELITRRGYDTRSEAFSGPDPQRVGQ